MYAVFCLCMVWLFVAPYAVYNALSVVYILYVFCCLLLIVLCMMSPRMVYAMLCVISVCVSLSIVACDLFCNRHFISNNTLDWCLKYAVCRVCCLSSVARCLMYALYVVAVFVWWRLVCCMQFAVCWLVSHICSMQYMLLLSVWCFLVCCMQCMSVVHILSIASCFVYSISCLQLSIVVYNLFPLTIAVWYQLVFCILIGVWYMQFMLSMVCCKAFEVYCMLNATFMYLLYAVKIYFLMKQS